MRSFLILAMSSLGFVVDAGVLRKRQASGISEPLFNTLSLYEQYAAAAYCIPNDSLGSGPVRCSAGNCPKVEAAATSIILSISTTPKTDTAAFIAVDDTNKLIVLSFRGSETVRNYMTDLTTNQISVGLCPGCYGFNGMYQAWGEVKSLVISTLQTAQNTYPSYRITTTGHSLGGGLSYVAAAELRSVGLVVDMATFASPRVGNVAWVNHVIDQAPTLGQNYRVTHLYDPVPSLPATSSGYAHISPDYFITTVSGVTPTAADIDVQVGIDNQNSWGPSLDADGQAHDFYFSNVTICYSSSSTIPLSGVLTSLQG